MLLVLLSLIVFGNGLRGDFVWDDEVRVVRNPAIRSLEMAERELHPE